MFQMHFTISTRQLAHALRRTLLRSQVSSNRRVSSFLLQAFLFQGGGARSFKSCAIVTVTHGSGDILMLVLSRKEGEQIVVPDCRLTVTVFDIHGERVRLGVSAPSEVRIYRGEVLHPIHVPNAGQETLATSALEDTSMSVRVLIADPDEYLIDNYRDYLEQHGCEVATAKTGVECIEKLRGFLPDVLILEPSIPWGGGDGVLAVMHEEPDVSSVPVIALTYGRDRGVLYRLAPFKINDYQIKPLSAKRLAQRIRSIIACNRDAHAPVLAGADKLGCKQ